MSLSFRDVVSTPRRDDRPRRPTLALYLSRSFLCSERTTSLQDPPLRFGEKPISLPLQHPDRLPHSRPRFPLLALFGLRLLTFLPNSTYYAQYKMESRSEPHT